MIKALVTAFGIELIVKYLFQIRNFLYGLGGLFSKFWKKIFSSSSGVVSSSGVASSFGVIGFIGFLIDSFFGIFSYLGRLFAARSIMFVLVTYIVYIEFLFIKFFIKDLTIGILDNKSLFYYISDFSLDSSMSSRFIMYYVDAFGLFDILSTTFYIFFVFMVISEYLVIFKIIAKFSIESIPLVPSSKA